MGVFAALLLSLPFLLFGLWLIDSPGRIELSCSRRGPCQLTRAGFFTTLESRRFETGALLGAVLERRRSARQGSENTFRAVLETTEGRFPLSTEWSARREDAEADVEAVRRFLADPARAPLRIIHDGRKLSLGIGAAFLIVGLILVGVAAWMVRRRARS